MASELTNRAALTYQYGENKGGTVSNVAKATLIAPLTIKKSSPSTQYRRGSEIVFLLTVTNNTEKTIEGMEVEDDLAAYMIPGPAAVTPLDYRGPARLYVDGAFRSELLGEEEEGRVYFSIPSLGGGEHALLLYKTRVNDYAPLAAGAVLTNDASLMAEELEEAVYAAYTLKAEDHAEVRLIKTMSPSPVTEGGMLRIRFYLYNYGNMPADGAVLTDALEPELKELSLEVEGAQVEPTEYDYVDGILTFPGEGAVKSLTVPAAQFEQGPDGLVHIDPGVRVVTLRGRI